MAQPETEDSSSYSEKLPKLEPEPIFGPYDESLMNLESFLEDSDDDQCGFLDENIPVPLPLRSTPDGLVKYENDLISGDIPLMVTVSYD